jgi:arginyl-tRNA synthetase
MLDTNSLYSYLNEEEKLLLKKMYFLPSVIEQVNQSYKPHILTNYLSELSGSINSWYTKYSVTYETNPQRKQAMLVLCQKLIQYQQQILDLLGIETLEEI